MSNDPDLIREQIEVTRGNLSTDVNTLADTVKPGNVARRQVDKVRGVVGNARDSVMGAASGVSSSAGSTAGGAGSKLGDAGSKLGDAASSSQDAVKAAPGALKSQTRGNPLAAGLIAFGAGWLVASLIPATQAEQQAATKAKENASVVTSPITDAAKEVGGHLQAPAQDAVAAVKSTATDAAATVRSEGTSSAQDLKDQSMEAKQAVQDSRS